MQTYDPSKVEVKFGNIGWVVVGESSVIEEKLPNITTTDMATYAKDHPEYAEDLVRVDVREVKDDKGNSFNVSFTLKKGNPQLEEILTLDPYDTTKIKAKTGE
jgi:Holliday junction resolvase-like predicted endonuclease